MLCTGGIVFNLYKDASFPTTIQLFCHALLCSFMIANSSETHKIIKLVKLPSKTHSNGV